MRFGPLVILILLQQCILSVFALTCYECFEGNVPPFNLTAVECSKENNYCLVI